MPKALFFNIPAAGHINPTLPLVAELVSRGFQIVYYALSDFGAADFGAAVKVTGADFRSYDDLSAQVRFHWLKEDDRSVSLIQLSALMMAYCEQLLPHLLEEIRLQQPDLILHDMTCLWGKMAAQILELPAVATFPQFPLNKKRRPEPYPGMLADFGRLALTGLGPWLRFRRSAGRISRDYRLERRGWTDMLANHEPLNLIFTSRNFQPYVEDFDDSYHFVGPSITRHEAPVDFPLEDGDKPILYISLGTIFHHKPEFYRACFEALGAGTWRVILSVGRRTAVDELGPIPANFTVRQTVPQLTVLEKAAVFVTHGGMNSVSEGLWFGRPLVVIPQSADQFFVAQRVKALGLGVVIYNRDMNAATLGQAVESVAGDRPMQERCLAMGDSFRRARGNNLAADLVMHYLSTSNQS